MKTVLEFHHKFHVWQQKRSSRIALTALFVLLIAVLAVPVLRSTYALHNNRVDIFEVLTGDELGIAAQQLEETGFIEIDGVPFGDVRLKDFQILADNGDVWGAFTK